MFLINAEELEDIEIFISEYRDCVLIIACPFAMQYFLVCVCVCVCLSISVLDT